jgi:hypothetical protein
MLAEAKATPIRAIRMSDLQLRLNEVNHLSIRGIRSSSLGHRSSTTRRRSMFSNRRISVKARTDMTMETRLWSEPDITELNVHWGLG